MRQCPALNGMGRKPRSGRSLLLLNLTAAALLSGPVASSADGLRVGAFTAGGGTGTFGSTQFVGSFGQPTVGHTDPVHSGIILPINQVPVATGPSVVTVTAGTATTSTLTATDADNNPLTYKIMSLPSNGTLYDGAGTGTQITSVGPNGYTLTDPNHQVTYLAPTQYSGGDAFSFKVNDSMVDSALATVNITVLPLVGSGGAVISEFRTRGSGGATDEYVEIANLTAGQLNVSGWKIAYPDGSGGEATAVIPANTVIPKGGHLLFTGSGYSLNSYALGDVTFTNSVNTSVGIPDNGGIELRNASNERVDAAGFSGAAVTYKEGSGIAAAITSNGEYSFMRQQRGTPYIDSGNNATDFDFVAVTGGAIDGVASKLGAPGPEGLTSPNLRNDTLSAVALPVFRDVAATGPNATFGTLAVRYKVTNNGSQKITRLRFRAVMIPSGAAISGGSWQTANGTADLRLLTSADTTATINGVSVPVKGSTLEQPPTQANGGGLNSSMSLDLSGLPGGGIASTETVNVQFAFGVVVKGTYRAVLNMEGLP